MTITIFATSTTGLLNASKPLSHDSQPRMIGIAAVMLSPKWQERAAMHFLIQPEGTVTTKDAKAAHGISDRERELYGIRRRAALIAFLDMTRASTELCSWALDFHSAIIDIELDRAKADVGDWRRGGLKRTSLNLEAAARYNDGRTLSLPDAHAAAIGIAYESPERDKHLHDVHAAVRVLMDLRKPKT